jgi:hypothetical protein
MTHFSEKITIRRDEWMHVGTYGRIVKTIRRSKHHVRETNGGGTNKKNY